METNCKHAATQASACVARTFPLRGSPQYPQTSILIAPLPCVPCRYYHAVAAAGGRLFALGGLVPGSAVTDTVEAFDPSTGLWTAYTSLPTPIQRTNALGVGGMLYLLGGAVDGACTLTAQVCEHISNLYYTLFIHIFITSHTHVIAGLADQCQRSIRPS